MGPKYSRSKASFSPNTLAMGPILLMALEDSEDREDLVAEGCQIDLGSEDLSTGLGGKNSK